MQLRYTCRWHKIADTFYGVTFGSNGKLLPGVITLNEVGYDIVQMLEQPTSREAITACLLTEYEADEADVQAAVDEVLDYLRAQQVLME